MLRRIPAFIASSSFCLLVCLCVSIPDSAWAGPFAPGAKISRQDSLLLAAPPRLDPSQIAWQSALLPAWGAWQSEHHLIATAQAVLDGFGLALVFSRPNPDAGSGLVAVVGLGILALNRLVNCPLNVFLAQRYNSDRVDDPFGSPPFHDDRYHLGLNGRLGLGGRSAADQAQTSRLMVQAAATLWVW
jgi:hypothetical protein